MDPATIRIATPFDFAYALMAGLGPMNAASIAPDRSASLAAGPALKVDASRVTFGPSDPAKKPFSTPMIAGAWVTFGM